MVTLIFSIILTMGCTSNAYNILIIHPGASYSNQQPALGLTEALVKKGHNVYAVAPNVVPGLESNYTFVDMSFSYSLYAGGVDAKTNKEAVNLQKPMTLREFVNAVRGMAKVPSHQFKSEQFLEFQRKVKEDNLSFDVVIGQSWFIPFACGMARFLASTKPCPPIISTSTIAEDSFTEGPSGSLAHPSFVPYQMPYTDRMTLWQKLDNWMIALFVYPEWRGIFEDEARHFFQETYGVGQIVDGCWSNVSLVLSTSSFLHAYPRSLGPNVVEVGPLHIRTPSKLPQILQDWLDGAEKGVIYMSLGSNMRSTSLPLDIRENLLRVFRELPTGFRVLWKWEKDEKIPGQSPNVLVQKWLPQQSILAHPKVKVYMMQGGFQSFQEAVHYGVPTVVMPWFGDQETNAVKMEAAGIGIGVRPHELHTYGKIKAALEQVLHNESYSKNMKRLSEISRDFTAQSIPKAVFWVEHVAKHGGAAHLRPSTADASYFQYFCLDLICVVIAFSSLGLYIVFWSVKFVISSALSKLKPKLS